jgi:hypothetical protein
MEKMAVTGKQMAHENWKFLMLFLSVFLLLFGYRVQAADETTNGSLTIQLEDLGTPMEGVGFHVYRVGYRETNGEWELESELSGLGAELNDLTYAAQWDAAAARLAYLVNDKRRRGIYEKYDTTDSSGQAQIGNLPDGLYLVVQDGGEAYGDISPFLISIPYKQDSDTEQENSNTYTGSDGWSDSVTVYPKASYTEEEDSGKITVTKKIGYLDMSLMEMVRLIPKDTTYYVGIFRDALGTVPYGADYVREIHMQGVSTGTAEFDGLPRGTYYIFETDENGNAIPVDVRQEYEGNTMVCQMDGSSTQEVRLTSEEASTGFVNVYSDRPEDTSYRGTIEITLDIFIPDDSQITEDEEFYAGIFRDEDGTDLVSVVELEPDGTVEQEVPLGGEKGDEPITYYVYETDENGVRIDEDEFPYVITLDPEVELRKGKPGGEITITNTKKVPVVTKAPEITPTPEVTSEPEITPTPETVPAEGGGSSGSSSVKTGDTTPIAGYLLTVAAAIAVIAGAGFMYMRRRRRK